MVALLLSLIFKKSVTDDDDLEQDEEELVLASDEEWMHRIPGEDGMETWFWNPNTRSLRQGFLVA